MPGYCLAAKTVNCSSIEYAMIEALIDVTLPQAASHDSGFYPAAVQR